MKAKTKKNTLAEMTKHIALLYAQTNDLNNRLRTIEEQTYKNTAVDLKIDTVPIESALRTTLKT